MKPFFRQIGVLMCLLAGIQLARAALIRVLWVIL